MTVKVYSPAEMARINAAVAWVEQTQRNPPRVRHIPEAPVLIRSRIQLAGGTGTDEGQTWTHDGAGTSEITQALLFQSTDFNIGLDLGGHSSSGDPDVGTPDGIENTTHKPPGGARGDAEGRTLLVRAHYKVGLERFNRVDGATTMQVDFRLNEAPYAAPTPEGNIGNGTISKISSSSIDDTVNKGNSAACTVHLLMNPGDVLEVWATHLSGEDVYITSEEALLVWVEEIDHYPSPSFLTGGAGVWP